MLQLPSRLRLRKSGVEFAKAAGLIALYGGWMLFFRLLCLSFLVYFLTRAGRTASFEEINEVFSTNEIPFIGLGSAVFVLLLRGLSPMPEDAPAARDWKKARRAYFAGLLQGSVLSASVVLAFLAVGAFRFVGFFVQIEDTPLALLGILVRIGAILVMCFGEEYLFRKRNSPAPAWIFSIAILYCGVKAMQFELSWMHFATLALLSVMLSLRHLTEGDYLGGAGFWSGCLLVFHPLASLPVFGSDFSGVFLLKYQAQSHLPAIISGGPGGPLSGVAFQVILLFEMARGFLAYKKSLLLPPSTQ